METSGDRPRTEGGRPPERKTSQRPAPDTRRKRPPQSRYIGWEDGLAREFCARAAHVLPTSFPVASHHGAATIATAIVASRAGSLLLCTYSHCGAHAWPDGELVPDASTGEAPPPENDRNSSASKTTNAIN